MYKRQGIENLASAIGEEKGTLEDVVEPFLIQEGLIQRTSRGRVATPNAYKYFNIELPENKKMPEQLDPF